MGHKSISDGGRDKRVQTEDEVEHIEQSPTTSWRSNTQSFQENAILKLKEVFFPNFDDVSILEMFTAIGWVHFMQLEELIFSELVREFYITWNPLIGESLGLKLRVSSLPFMPIRLIYFLRHQLTASIFIVEKVEQRLKILIY